MSKLHIKSSIPNQSQRRMIEPKFPGSLIFSRATIFLLKSISLNLGILKTAKTLFGVFKLLIIDNFSLLILKKQPYSSYLVSIE